MKSKITKYLLLLLAACSLFMHQSCKPASAEADPDYPSDYDINYELREVLEIDPVNINGIDVYPYFDFFKTLRFTIHVRDGKMSTLEFTNGDIPFAPHSFNIPAGEVECWFDTSSSPNALRLKSDDSVVAYLKKGELYMPFKLDCQEIDYEYRFKEIVK